MPKFGDYPIVTTAGKKFTEDERIGKWCAGRVLTWMSSADNWLVRTDLSVLNISPCTSLEKLRQSVADRLGIPQNEVILQVFGYH